MSLGSTPVILIGMMGAGKTSVGKALARALGRRFLDADHEIEARCGVSIPTIFELEGESGFRKREAQVIDELTVMPDIVLATGGGAVLLEENRECLASRGIVVYLVARPEDIFERTRHDRNRPLLQVEDPLGRIRTLLEQRSALYEGLADVRLETGRSTIGRLVQRLIPMLDAVNKPLPNTSLA